MFLGLVSNSINHKFSMKTPTKSKWPHLIKEKCSQEALQRILLSYSVNIMLITQQIKHWTLSSTRKIEELLIKH